MDDHEVKAQLWLVGPKLTLTVPTWQVALVPRIKSSNGGGHGAFSFRAQDLSLINWQKLMVAISQFPLKSPSSLWSPESALRGRRSQAGPSGAMQPKD